MFLTDLKAKHGLSNQYKWRYKTCNVRAHPVCTEICYCTRSPNKNMEQPVITALYSLDIHQIIKAIPYIPADMQCPYMVSEWCVDVDAIQVEVTSHQHMATHGCCDGMHFARNIVKVSVQQEFSCNNT